MDEETERRLLLIPLLDGRTTLEEVVLAYGIPSARFDKDRILCYRFWETEQGIVVLGRESKPNEPWKERSADMNLLRWAYNLILVFDDRAVLARHRVLCIRHSQFEPPRRNTPNAGVNPKGT